MTLCVGLVDGDRVIIGADSMATDDADQGWTLSEEKVWERGGILWADAGPILPSQRLRTMDPPEPNGNVRGWVADSLTPAIRKRLKGCYSSKADRAGHEILIGIRGQLAILCPETWEALWYTGPVAIGHPPAVAAARGSLYATGQSWSDGVLGLDAEARIRIALEAGAMVSPYVSGPWAFVSA